MAFYFPFWRHFRCQGHLFAVMTMLSSQMHSFCKTSLIIFRFKVYDVQTPAQWKYWAINSFSLILKNAFFCQLWTPIPWNLPYVVYIGRLKKETSEEDHRAHITYIAVPSDDIADVIPLRCRNEAQSSYCISLNSKSAESIVLCDKNWPHAVWVCLFHPRRRNNMRLTRLKSSTTSGNYNRNYHRNNWRNYRRTQVANYPYKAPRHLPKYAGSGRPFLKPQNNKSKGYQDSPDYYYTYHRYDEHYYDEKYSQENYDAYTWY